MKIALLFALVLLAACGTPQPAATSSGSSGVQPTSAGALVPAVTAPQQVVVVKPTPPAPTQTASASQSFRRNFSGSFYGTSSCPWNGRDLNFYVEGNTVHFEHGSVATLVGSEFEIRSSWSGNTFVLRGHDHGDMFTGNLHNVNSSWCVYGFEATLQKAG